MKRLHIIWMIYLMSLPIHGQDVFRSFASAGTLGLSVLPVTAEAGSFLPGCAAALTRINSPGLLLSTTWPYTLADVIQAHASLVLPGHNNNYFGVQMAGQGDASLSEFLFSGAYAKKITDRWAAGLRAGVRNTSITNWASVWNVSIEASGLYQISDPFQLAYRAHYYTEAITREKVTSQIDQQLGLQFNPTPQLGMGVDIIQSTYDGWHYYVHLVYRIQEHFGLRMGHGFAPYQFGAGVDLKLWNGWTIQVATRYHPILRWSPGINLQIPLKFNRS